MTLIIQRAQKRNGKYVAVQVPIAIAEKLGITAGQYVEIFMENGFVLIKPHKVK